MKFKNKRSNYSGFSFLISNKLLIILVNELVDTNRLSLPPEWIDKYERTCERIEKINENCIN